jgi:hypothetical protein
MISKGVLCLAGLVCVASASASDRWEPGGDDSGQTINELQPGIVQEGHDLEAKPKGPDQDWYRILSRSPRSYEARVFGGGVRWGGAGCPMCAIVERVDQNGNGQGNPDSDSVSPGSISLRWIGNGSPSQWLRVSGNAAAPGLASEKYDIRLVDTTLFLPRFNNVGSQRTVLILQRTGAALGFAQVEFRDDSGGLLHTRLVTALSSAGVDVFDTATEPSLAGRSGSAVVLHTFGQEGLVGKAVGLDPVTGFTFDTALVRASN